MAKAYCVQDPGDDEGQMVIVHARDRVQAKRLGASELDYSEAYVLLSATRRPEFDDIVGDDLMRAQLKDGWWFECHGHDCRDRVTDYGEHEERSFVIREGSVYCSSACCLRTLRHERQERIEKWRAVERAVRRWPGAGITDSCYKNVNGDWIMHILRPENDYETVELLESETETMKETG